MSTPLRDFFDRIDLASIQRFVADRHPEALTLEFKTIGDDPFSQRDDRRNLAKAIAGFANAQELLSNVVDGGDQAASLSANSPLLNFTPAITSGSNVAPFRDRQ